MKRSILERVWSFTARPKHRRGATLMMSLFTILFTSILLTGLLNSVRVQVAEQAATAAYERANYMAGAAVHHALAELQIDLTWRTGVPITNFPPSSSDTYSATVTDGPLGEIIVTGVGAAGGVTRTLRVTIE